jgi:hypothetical protein
MIPRSFLTYVVARHNAVEMDRRGQSPGLLLRLLVGIGSLAVLGMAGCVLFVLVSFGLWERGVIR